MNVNEMLISPLFLNVAVILLFTLPRDVEPPVRFGCREVGVVTRGRAVRIVDPDGRARRLLARGWDHLAR